MNKLFFKRWSLVAILFFLSTYSWAQANTDSVSPTVDSVMRSNNKIYVVMAVCVLILLVLFLYLIRIDFKVSKKEKMM